VRSSPQLVDYRAGARIFGRSKLPQAADAATGVNYGSLAPISGWVSRKFDEKQPTPTIYWRGRLAGNSVLRCEIAC
jgi:hypothetical protein